MEEWNYFSQPPTTPAPTRRKMTAARRKRRRRQKIRRMLFALFFLAIAVLSIVMICKRCSFGKRKNASDGESDPLSGEYCIDDYTAYEFDGKGHGALCLGDTTRYVFDYTVEDSTLRLDYADVAIPDEAYTFALEDDTLLIENESISQRMTKIP